MNPVEYAIMSNASLKTVELLQNAAAKHLQGTSTCPGPTTMSLRRVSMANSDTSASGKGEVQEAMDKAAADTAANGTDTEDDEDDM
eukprot:scaffold10284_cov95-Skeletonema_dohrnii-CCMP3373.AAC.2